MTNEELICPILMELLEDPIQLPCCGRAISRQPLIDWLNNNKSKNQKETCPVCRLEIENFNPLKAPVLRNLTNIIDDIKSNGNKLFDNKSDDPNSADWKVTIDYDNMPGSNINIGLITPVSIGTIYKTLLIPVVDKSGSMEGHPLNQAKSSLVELVRNTYLSKSIITSVIAYESIATTIDIDKRLDQQTNILKINNIKSTGGTSFSSAFSEVVNVIKNKQYTESNITSITIIFLTDGEDSNSSKGKRESLVVAFKKQISSITNLPFTVHTIGFSNNHDYDFLNSLRMIGTTEGAYRYADPLDSIDSLSSKINSLLNVITTDLQVPVSITAYPQDLVELPNNNNNNKYWVRIVDLENSIKLVKTIPLLVNNKDNIIAEVNFVNNPLTMDKWYSHQIDLIASEISILSKSNLSMLSTKLHNELLLGRIKALRLKLEVGSPNSNRLGQLYEQLMILLNGGVIDQKKLIDIKFEGQYETKSIACNNDTKTKIIPKYSNTSSNYNYIHKKSSNWKLYVIGFKRCIANKESHIIYNLIARSNNQQVIDWIKKNSRSTINVSDENCSNPLIVACSVGRYNLIEHLKSHFDISATNYFGLNATDLAIIYGHWKTYLELKKLKLQPTLGGDILIRTCLSNGHLKMADILINDGLSVITEEMQENAPTSKILQYLNDKSKIDISIEACIEKGLVNKVKELLDNKVNFILSFNKILYLFAKTTTSDQYIIINLLLTNGILDANELITTVSGQTSTPLLIASEKSLIEFVELLLPYTDINQVNDNGNTALWLACSYGHLDMVSLLLENGADPNIVNFKGDSALVPCCQKGFRDIAEILLLSGINIITKNINLDTPLLITCRSNQPKMTELLLKYMKIKSEQLVIDEIEHCASIDGFNSLLGATEANSPKCINVLLDYGANVEFKTSINNKILAGATSLLLAAFYGKYNAIEFLLKVSKDLHATTSSLQTALHLSIKQGHSDVTRLLLQNEYTSQCINFPDIYGNTPRYYASMTGNELIYNEFFSSPLMPIFEQILNSDPETTLKCSDVLVKYGDFSGYSSYDKITDVIMRNGLSFMTNAILNGNKILIQQLFSMNNNLFKCQNDELPPMFWLVLTDNCITKDETINKLVSNIKKYDKMQDKLLLNLNNINKTKNKNIEDNSGDLNILSKMNMLFNKSDKTSSINFGNRGISLLQTINKLSEKYGRLVFDAKILTIKRLAIGDSYLEPYNIISLYMYLSSSEIFELVNKTLSDWDTNYKWHPFVRSLHDSLVKLPNHIGEVYKIINYDFNLLEMAVGNIISWNNFNICSEEWINASIQLNKKQGVIFIINSITGKSVCKYSKMHSDKEIIFLPNTRFRIINHYLPDIVIFGQKNVRKSYIPTEYQYSKEFYKNSTVIVELTEID